MKPGPAKNIAIIYQQACTHGMAFACYRLPNAKRSDHIIGTASHRLRDDERAFAFAPFDTEKKPYYITAQSPGHKNPAGFFLEKSKQKSTTKNQFTQAVKEIISRIAGGDFKKVVAARVLAINKPSSFDPVVFFKKLCDYYPSAFVSMTLVPGVGLWIGASPEILVSETESSITSYSLAGTKAVDDPTKWSGKEKEEQQIVSDFIYKKLHKAIGKKISINGPLAHDAGRVKHLLTVFTIHHSGKSKWRKLAKALHPTPAVGGLPQRKAVKFIIKKESFDRRFYAGYLGPVDQSGGTNLFVNLRCVEVTGTQLLFYAGCGVTAASDPEKEWQESERKIDVIKGLI